MKRNSPDAAAAAPLRRGGRRVDRFEGNVFVANLPRGFTDEELARAFDAFGLVLGAFLARDPITKATKTHGLVNIAPASAATKAVAALNGAEIGGRRIDVRLADPNMSLVIPPVRGATPRTERASEPMQTRRPVQVEYRAIRRGS